MSKREWSLLSVALILFLVVLPISGAIGGSDIKGSNAMITAEGGFAFSMYNLSGENCTQGELVSVAPINADDSGYYGFARTQPSGAESGQILGIVYKDASGNDEVANGTLGWVVTSGLAFIALDFNDTAVTRGNHVYVSTSTPGRANCTETAMNASSMGILIDSANKHGNATNATYTANSTVLMLIWGFGRNGS